VNARPTIAILLLSLLTPAAARAETPAAELAQQIEALRAELRQTQQQVRDAQAETARLRQAIENHGENALLQAWLEEKRRIDAARLSARRQQHRVDETRDALRRLVRAESLKVEAAQRRVDEAAARAERMAEAAQRPRRTDDLRPSGTTFFHGPVYVTPHAGRLIGIPRGYGIYRYPYGAYPYPGSYGTGIYHHRHHHHHGGGFRIQYSSPNLKIRIGG